jgi:hypothetical protein
MVGINCFNNKFSFLDINVFAVFRIHDILVWIRILDPDPAIFVIDLLDASKKLIFKHNFFCLLHLEGTLTLFFKDKKSNGVTK